MALSTAFITTALITPPTRSPLFHYHLLLQFEKESPVRKTRIFEKQTFKKIHTLYRKLVDIDELFQFVNKVLNFLT